MEPSFLVIFSRCAIMRMKGNEDQRCAYHYSKFISIISYQRPTTYITIEYIACTAGIMRKQFDNARLKLNCVRYRNSIKVEPHARNQWRVHRSILLQDAPNHTTRDMHIIVQYDSCYYINVLYKVFGNPIQERK